MGGSGVFLNENPGKSAVFFGVSRPSLGGGSEASKPASRNCFFSKYPPEV